MQSLLCEGSGEYSGVVGNDESGVVGVQDEAVDGNDTGVLGEVEEISFEAILLVRDLSEAGDTEESLDIREQASA